MYIEDEETDRDEKRVWRVFDVRAHTTQTILAGDFLGDYVSQKVVAYTGGALFLAFAAATALDVATR